MGYYLNPKAMSKKDWLDTYAVRINRAPPRQFRDEEHIVICLVDNGFFTAAGIAFSQAELEAFTYEDGREKIWYTIPIKDLIAEDPLMAEVIERMPA